jgi:surfeit locus 1 family protein
MAQARSLERVAPFYVEADATPNPGGWPRGGQTRLNLPNNHLQYALTWYGIALTLIGVFVAFAWPRLRPSKP